MLSENYLRTVNAVSADESPIYLLEISHEGLPQPLRFANYDVDVISNANTYIGTSFHIDPPSQPDGGLPQAALSISNIGKELTTWIDLTSGGRGAIITVRCVLPSTPDVIEWEAPLELTNVNQNVSVVRGQLGFKDILNQPAVSYLYTAANHPGIV